MMATGRCVKIKEMNYGEDNSMKLYRSTSTVRNPIRVVVSMIGEDGQMHQQIVNQDQQQQIRKSKMMGTVRSQKVGLKKVDSTPLVRRTYQSTNPKGLSRDFVFNKFHYDNYRDFIIPKTRNSMPSKRSKPNPNHKNIEIVFCENKLPEFVQKTNNTIEELYKQEQIHEHSVKQHLVQHARNVHMPTGYGVSPKRIPKTTLANCLKEYATLEKLSMFMENDQRRRQSCMCFQIEKDPSRNLLLDIITHRFNFLKTMGKKMRNSIYRSLLGRQVNPLTKINIQEYMKICEMFVGRDASSHQVAAFMSIFLFGSRQPSFQLARDRLIQLNGHIHKLRMLLQELEIVMSKPETEYLVDVFGKKQRLLRLFIDYIIERQ